MPTDEGVEYYLNRRRASVAMSLTAEDPGVRKIHRDFAQRYADLAGVFGAEPKAALLRSAREAHDRAS